MLPAFHRGVWKKNKKACCFNKQNVKKANSNSHVLKTKFHKLQSLHSVYRHICTDGFNDEEKVGCAFSTNNFSKTLRPPDSVAIFTVQIKAVEVALEFYKTPPINKYVI